MHVPTAQVAITQDHVHHVDASIKLFFGVFFRLSPKELDKLFGNEFAAKRLKTRIYKP